MQHLAQGVLYRNLLLIDRLVGHSNLILLNGAIGREFEQCKTVTVMLTNNVQADYSFEIAT